jgi:hypothetical protein
MAPASAYALTTGSTPAQAGGPTKAQPVAALTAKQAPKRSRARFRLRPRAINALGGQTVHIRGHLLPALRGSRVRLDGLFGGHWRTLASSRTGRSGGFDVRYSTAGDPGQHRLRVLFKGDRFATLAKAKAGSLTVYTPMVASWYDDGGDTACGFHAYYGVANKSLPCGTKVRFAYRGHAVTATVDDRGPFVPGRDWDLNQNTAAALGFGGVDTVWASVS